MRLGAAAYNMAEAIAALARGKPLNALEFTENEEASEAVSLSSGLKVWTTLPTGKESTLKPLVRVTRRRWRSEMFRISRSVDRVQKFLAAMAVWSLGL